MHLFYTPDIQETQSAYTLNEEESRHCIQVLRLGTGAEISLIDGRGGFFTATIQAPHPKRTLLSIIQYTAAYGKRNHYLHLAVAPTKNTDRFEWFLEKATEIGIDEITPLICEHSERKEIKPERLHKIITAAMKQSLKAYHPQLNSLVKWDSFIGKEQTSNRFIAHCIEGKKQFLSEVITPGGAVTILIGPEGDFSTTEVMQAEKAGFIPVTLGAARLRTETAAVAACLEVNMLNRV